MAQTHVPPTETVMKLTDTKQQLSQIINRVARGETRVVVEKSGLPVAVIISTDEYRQFKEREEARRVRREEIHELFSNPEDDVVLATAVSAHADYLVTGDRQLLRLGAFEGVALISPAGFVEVLWPEEA